MNSTSYKPHMHSIFRAEDDPRTLSPEMDAWLAAQQSRQPVGSRGVPSVLSRADRADVMPCVFTAAELAVIWPQLQRLRTGGPGFAGSFLKTALERLTPRGKAIVHEIAHKYRCQVFGKKARTWHIAETVEAWQARAKGSGA